MTESREGKLNFFFALYAVISPYLQSLANSCWPENFRMGFDCKSSPKGLRMAFAFKRFLSLSRY